MGTPMTLMHARPKGRAGIQTPLLGFLAGPHADLIAQAWPAPHSGFFTLPTARRHAAAILLGRGTEMRITEIILAFFYGFSDLDISFHNTKGITKYLDKRI